MNDEIKEILEHIQYVIDEDDYWEVTKVTLKPLLDYITNLQQENFNLRENILIHKMSFKSDDKSLEHLITMPSYEELQQENEKLKEYIRIANVSEWFKGNDSLEKLLQNDRNDDKKVISKADFNKVWSESTTEDILNQFYYEHNDLREMLKENGNKEEVIKRQQEVISKIETLIINHNCDTGDIYYKYNNKYLKSELKERILEIIEGSAKGESK